MILKKTKNVSRNKFLQFGEKRKILRENFENKNSVIITEVF